MLWLLALVPVALIAAKLAVPEVNDTLDAIGRDRIPAIRTTGTKASGHSSGVLRMRSDLTASGRAA
jgi:hypothetical protein